MVFNNLLSADNKFIHFIARKTRLINYFWPPSIWLQNSSYDQIVSSLNEQCQTLCWIGIIDFCWILEENSTSNKKIIEFQALTPLYKDERYETLVLITVDYFFAKEASWIVGYYLCNISYNTSICLIFACDKWVQKKVIAIYLFDFMENSWF